MDDGENLPSIATHFHKESHRSDLSQATNKVKSNDNSTSKELDERSNANDSV